MSIAELKFLIKKSVLCIKKIDISYYKNRHSYTKNYSCKYIYVLYVHGSYINFTLQFSDDSENMDRDYREDLDDDAADDVTDMSDPYDEDFVNEDASEYGEDEDSEYVSDDEDVTPDDADDQEVEEQSDHDREGNHDVKTCKHLISIKELKSRITKVVLRITKIDIHCKYI